MLENNFRVLIIEDNPPDAELLTESLCAQETCFQIDWVETMARAE